MSRQSPICRGARGQATKGRRVMSLRINDIAPTLPPIRPRARSAFTTGSATAMRSCFASARLYPGLHHRIRRRRPTDPRIRKARHQVLGVSVDSVEDHGKWKRDIEAVAGVPANFAIIDDTALAVAKAYDMLPAEYYLPAEGRTPAHSATVRTVFIIGPDRKVRLTMTYPMSVGRNFRRDPGRWTPFRPPTACAGDARELGAGSGRHRGAGAGRCRGRGRNTGNWTRSCPIICALPARPKAPDPRGQAGAKPRPRPCPSNQRVIGSSMTE